MADKWILNLAKELHNGWGSGETVVQIIQRHYDAAAKCPRCDGTKFETVEYDNCEGIDDGIERPCSHCHGRGKVAP